MTIAALFFSLFVQLQRQRWLLDHFGLLPQWWAFFFYRKIKHILLKAAGKVCLKELVLNQDILFLSFLSSQPRFENWRVQEKPVLLSLSNTTPQTDDWGLTQKKAFCQGKSTEVRHLPLPGKGAGIQPNPGVINSWSGSAHALSSPITWTLQMKSSFNQVVVRECFISFSSHSPL